ncbi:hypothetical protein PR202_ga16935 [Eleusine coracana subsp. coracana]|uniref:Uncharacterized protein n=1 Tax=Eleusine coracana subsp. coracana TaxID=191504 RepID=A0AAV5CNP4_ELECO|nr:hypothetical protein PR202_ga16935 [Eleusine coracana subsp. coracana]
MECGTAIGCAETPRGCARDRGHGRGDGGSASTPGDNGDGRWRRGRFRPGRGSKAVDVGGSFFGCELQCGTGSIGTKFWSVGIGLKVLSVERSEQSTAAERRDLHLQTRWPTRKEGRFRGKRRVRAVACKKEPDREAHCTWRMSCRTDEARCGRRRRRRSIELDSGGGWRRSLLEGMEDLPTCPWVGWTQMGRQQGCRAMRLKWRQPWLACVSARREEMERAT